MNYSGFVDRIAGDAGLNKPQAVEAFLAVLTSCAKAGDGVALTGFGQCKVKDTPERQGRNLSTGRPMTVAAARKITFTPSKALKDALKSAQ
jgi:DNA-binding protein HU-beta